MLWLPAVLLHLCCCACHIFTACAVVPGVSPCVCVVFFEVAVYFLLLLLLLRRCGSVLLWCLVVAGVVFWFRGLLGASCCLWCVLFWFGLFGCVALSEILWCCCFVCGWCCVGVCLVCVLSLVGVLSVLVLVCFGWSAFLLLVVLWLLRCCVVARVFLLCVAPSWCWLLLVGSCVWLFFLVVGLLVLLSPLFLVRHDQARLWSCSWFNAECHPGWVAVWCFCSWRLCLWVVVCHPVGSSAPCFSCFVASCSSVCCSCFVSVLSVLCCVPVCYCVSSDLSVFVSVCVYCCDSFFSSWSCSSLLSVAVCLDLFSVHVVCGLWVKCCVVVADLPRMGGLRIGLVCLPLLLLFRRFCSLVLVCRLCIVFSLFFLL